MRYVFRALALMLALGFAFNLGIAQKSLKELPDGAADDLTKQGDRESHQGADNPMQGSRSNASGRFGGPDPYGPEGFEAFINKAEMKFNDPQWQLKLDLQPPKRIVVQHPGGSAKEYWYVLFRVINDNTREIKQTVLPEPYGDEVDVNNPKTSLKVEDRSTGEREGVPADAHLNFELHVFTRDIEKNPWDTQWPDDPENAVLTPIAAAEPGDLLAIVRRAGERKAHEMAQQFLAQFRFFRRDAGPDDETGRGSAAHVQDWKFPSAKIFARQMVDGHGVGIARGRVIYDTLLAILRIRSGGYFRPVVASCPIEKR
jgi:hypothetical protein